MVTETILTSQTLCGLVILSVVVLATSYRWLRKRPLLAPLPPGPKPIPFIGNAHQVPQEYPEKTYLSWGRQYGESLLLYFCPNLLTFA